MRKFFIFFGCVYLILYMFPAPLQEIPYAGYVTQYLEAPLDEFSLFIGETFFGNLGVYKIYSGSGDTFFDYYRILALILLALLISIPVFVFIKEKYINTTKSITIIYLRYFLGLTLFSYGISKIFWGQFIPPDHAQLTERFGDATPMGLLWTFMGYSKAFTVFCGSFQVAAGFLLFFRRTFILGSILSIIAFTHIAVLNFCYDVPVKLFSLHLLLISLVIFYPYAKNIFDFLLLKNVPVLSTPVFNFSTKWIRITRMVLKVIFVGLVPIYYLVIGFMYMRLPDGPLNGFYTIQKLEVIAGPGQEKDTTIRQWQSLSLQETYQFGYIVTKKDTIHFSLTTHEDQKKISIIGKSDGRFSYKFLPKNKLELRGSYAKDSLHLILKKKDLNQYRLMNTGFHWIQDYPNNR